VEFFLGKWHFENQHSARPVSILHCISFPISRRKYPKVSQEKLKMKLCQCFNALGEWHSQNKHHLASPWVRQDVILPHQTLWACCFVFFSPTIVVVFQPKNWESFENFIFPKWIPLILLMFWENTPNFWYQKIGTTFFQEFFERTKVIQHVRTDSRTFRYLVPYI
jgi:hypothetical protein